MIGNRLCGIEQIKSIYYMNLHDRLLLLFSEELSRILWYCL